MSDVWRAVAVLALVLGNAIFVAAEYALVTARRNRLEDRAENGNRRARRALRLMDEPVRFISTVQIGVTIFSILLGAIGEPLLSGFFDPYMPRTASFLLSFGTRSGPAGITTSRTNRVSPAALLSTVPFLAATHQPPMNRSASLPIA